MLDSVLLKGYVDLPRVCLLLTLMPMLTWFIAQIRIITDTHAHLRPKKKKKPHRGYAFVVFERERDMRGNLFPSPILIPLLVLSLSWLRRTSLVASQCVVR